MSESAQRSRDETWWRASVFSAAEWKRSITNQWARVCSLARYRLLQRDLGTFTFRDVERGAVKSFEGARGIVKRLAAQGIVFELTIRKRDGTLEVAERPLRRDLGLVR